MKPTALTAAAAALISSFSMAAQPRTKKPDPDAIVADVCAAISSDQVRATVERLAGFGTRHTQSDTKSDERGIGAARRWIHSQFNLAGGRLEVSFDPHVVEGEGGRLPAGSEVVNVVAVLPGTIPEARGRQYYVIAHYDSRAGDGADSTSDAPGANDDGSGVAVVLELARVLADRPLESTVVFMAIAGEEQGLYGARMHARAAAAAGADIRAVLNNDTVGDPTGPDGRAARHEIRVFSEGVPLAALDAPDPAGALRRIRAYGAESDSPSRQLARFIAETASAHTTSVQPRLIFRPDRFLRGGDHTPFNELGFAAVRFCEVYEDYDRQHQDPRVEDGVQYGDLPGFVDADYLADVARLNAAVLIGLADAPSAPSDVRIVTASLSNDTTLRWSPSPEPDVAGYEIVWRSTTDSTWTNARDVGDMTDATLDLSKDNWLFGVRAYDTEGNRSPVAFPVAARR